MPVKIKRNSISRYERVKAFIDNDVTLKRKLSQEQVTVVSPEGNRKDFPMEIIVIADTVCQANGGLPERLDVIRAAWRCLDSPEKVSLPPELEQAESDPAETEVPKKPVPVSKVKAELNKPSLVAASEQVPKRRGRPRKQVLIAIPALPVQEVPAAPAKRRGRPRKQATAEAPDAPVELPAKAKVTVAEIDTSEASASEFEGSEAPRRKFADPVQAVPALSKSCGTVREGSPNLPAVAALSNLYAALNLLQACVSEGDLEGADICRKLDNLITRIHVHSIMPSEKT